MRTIGRAESFVETTVEGIPVTRQIVQFFAVDVTDVGRQPLGKASVESRDQGVISRVSTIAPVVSDSGVLRIGLRRLGNRPLKVREGQTHTGNDRLRSGDIGRRACAFSSGPR